MKRHVKRAPIGLAAFGCVAVIQLARQSLSVRNVAQLALLQRGSEIGLS